MGYLLLCEMDAVDEGFEVDFGLCESGFDESLLKTGSGLSEWH